jgi:hypothetical protein
MVAAPDPAVWPPAATAKSTTAPDWSPDGATDADCLFFACPPEHTLITNGHCQTEATDTGRLAWTDRTTPPEINHAHHPKNSSAATPTHPTILRSESRQALVGLIYR